MVDGNSLLVPVLRIKRHFPQMADEWLVTLLSFEWRLAPAQASLKLVSGTIVTAKNNGVHLINTKDDVDMGKKRNMSKKNTTPEESSIVQQLLVL